MVHILYGVYVVSTFFNNIIHTIIVQTGMYSSIPYVLQFRMRQRWSPGLKALEWNLFIKNIEIIPAFYYVPTFISSTVCLDVDQGMPHLNMLKQSIGTYCHFNCFSFFFSSSSFSSLSPPVDLVSLLTCLVNLRTCCQCSSPFPLANMLPPRLQEPISLSFSSNDLLQKFQSKKCEVLKIQQQIKPGRQQHTNQ